MLCASLGPISKAKSQDSHSFDFQEIIAIISILTIDAIVRYNRVDSGIRYLDSISDSRAHFDNRI